jgi:hypothetical protein
LLRWDAEKHEVVQYRLERDLGIFCQGIAQGQRSVRRQFGDRTYPATALPRPLHLLRTAARAGTRDLDWSNGGNWFRRLQMQLVAFLATLSRGAAAITTFYRLYGER